MALYVQVIDGSVKHCWDNLAGETVGVNGWKNAVEVRPEIDSKRQRYTPHTFDITKDPVEIVYGIEEIAVAERKATMLAEAEFLPRELMSSMAKGTIAFNAASITAAQEMVAPKVARINACTTHDELDAVN
jgi:hypothetical protein